jgi:hypothetical protein
VLLGAATTSANPADANYEELPNEYGDDSRMGHSLAARGKVGSLLDAPMLIGDREKLLERITPVNLDSLHFTISCERDGGVRHEVLTLQPFYTLHHVRYMIYWLRQTPEEWLTNPMVRQAAEDALTEQRTIDEVAPGEQQSEAGHAMKTQGGTWCGTNNGEIYRSLNNRDSWVEYTLSTGVTTAKLDTTQTSAPELSLRLSANDGGRRLMVRFEAANPLTSADIEREVLIPLNAAQHSSDGFTEVSLTLPWAALLRADGSAKPEVTVRFAPSEKSGFPGLYRLRMLRGE